MQPTGRAPPRRVEQLPEQFASWLAGESGQWASLIKAAGIKVE